MSTVGLPLLATLAVAVVSRNDFPSPHSVGPFILWLMGQLALSALTYAGVSHLTLRLLPLAALLKMTLVFPDRAPSRLAVARRAGSVRNLDARVEHARGRIALGTPGEAAAIIIELVGALSRHDRLTRGHSERVRALTDLLADELELAPSTRNRLRWSALLHDIGKLTVHAHILNKPDKLDAQEWEAIKQHPLEGAKLVAPLIPWLGEWSKTIEQHHERYNGSGYPYGLAGNEISYGARIVAVADAFDVMTAKRSYKDAISPQAARAELTRCAGTQFDPEVVRAFLSISLGQLRWTLGPAAAVAQLPVLGDLPFVAGRATGALSVVGSSAAVSAVGAVTLGAAGLVGPIGLPSASATTALPAVTSTASTAESTSSVQLQPLLPSPPRPATSAPTTMPPASVPTTTVPATSAPTTTVPATNIPALPIAPLADVTLPSEPIAPSVPTVTVPTIAVPPITTGAGEVLSAELTKREPG